MNKIIKVISIRFYLCSNTMIRSRERKRENNMSKMKKSHALTEIPYQVIFIDILINKKLYICKPKLITRKFLIFKVCSLIREKYCIGTSIGIHIPRRSGNKYNEFLMKYLLPPELFREAVRLFFFF